MTYTAIVLTLKEMSYLIHALHATYENDIAWWDASEKTKREALRETRDLIEIQFFLQESAHEALNHPHGDPAVTSSLFDFCGELQQWIDTQVSPCYKLHAVIPIDVEGTMVIVFTQ